jgi:hypothetical protein
MEVTTTNITPVKLSNKKENEIDNVLTSIHVNKFIVTIACESTVS